MGSWSLALCFYSGWLSSLLLSFPPFAPSFLSFTSTISVSPYGQEVLHSFSLDTVLVLIYGLGLLASFKTIKTLAKTLIKLKTTRYLNRRSLASPVTRRQQHAHLVLNLLQISSTLPRFQYILAEHVLAYR